MNRAMKMRGFDASGETVSYVMLSEMAARRNYLNYTTPAGVDLARVAMAGWLPFLIHESGWRPALEDWNHPGVDSPFWRFYHNPKPGCHVMCGGERYPLEPDNALLIPADTLFDCCASGPACHFWLHFTTAKPGVTMPLRPIVLPVAGLLPALLEELISTHQQAATEARDQRLLHLSASLLHVVFADLPHEPPNALPDRMLHVLAFIARSPGADLSNVVLADRAGLPVERFIRTFRKHTGQTPAVYVMASRVRAAEQLLALTSKSVDQIAVECGFANRHYFSRVFARTNGCGPAEFRKRQGERKGR